MRLIEDVEFTGYMLNKHGTLFAIDYAMHIQDAELIPLSWTHERAEYFLRRSFKLGETRYLGPSFPEGQTINAPMCFVLSQLYTTARKGRDRGEMLGVGSLNTGIGAVAWWRRPKTPKGNSEKQLGIIGTALSFFITTRLFETFTQLSPAFATDGEEITSFRTWSSSTLNGGVLP